MRLPHHSAAIAALALSVLVLAGCHDPIAPRDGAISPPARARFDHQSIAVDLAFHRCQPAYDEDFNTYRACAVFIPGGLEVPDAYGPSWSPDATRVAVDDGADVLVVTLADSATANLTRHAAADHSPAWSPDGRSIAFLSDRDGQQSLYLMSAVDGSGVTRLTTGVEVLRKPTWAPNGQQIAFTCRVEPGNTDVCAVNTDGSGFTRLTSDPWCDFDPDWAPDGARIAFVTCRFYGTDQWGYSYSDLATMTPDGDNVTRITRSSNLYQQPDWSPGGSRIAYSLGFNDYCDAGMYNGCGEPSLFVMNADGTGVGKIGSGSQPAWRPDAADPLPATNEAPVARFTYSCTDLRCWFYGSTSSDDHGVAGYDWSFGDGTSKGYFSTSSSTSHDYKASGTYEVTLTVMDWDGLKGSVTQSVTTGSAPPDDPPVASFSWSCGLGRACSFSSSASSDDHGIVSRSWTFGDGATSGNVVAPGHTYAANGTYDVTLMVTDAAGQSSSVTHAVVAVDESPVARFEYSCSASSCTFDARGSTDDRGISSYSWDLGRYGTFGGSVVTIQLRGRGAFTATLTVLDYAAQTNSTSQTVNAK